MVIVLSDYLMMILKRRHGRTCFLVMILTLLLMMTDYSAELAAETDGLRCKCRTSGNARLRAAPRLRAYRQRCRPACHAASPVSPLTLPAVSRRVNMLMALGSLPRTAGYGFAADLSTRTYRLPRNELLYDLSQLAVICSQARQVSSCVEQRCARSRKNTAPRKRRAYSLVGTVGSLYYLLVEAATALPRHLAVLLLLVQAGRRCHDGHPSAACRLPTTLPLFLSQFWAWDGATSLTRWRAGFGDATRDDERVTAAQRSDILRHLGRLPWDFAASRSVPPASACCGNSTSTIYLPSLRLCSSAKPAGERIASRVPALCILSAGASVGFRWQGVKVLRSMSAASTR